MAPQIAPYGSWVSPISSDAVVAGSLRLGEIRMDGADIYWSEGRPAEGGRSVVMQRSPQGTVREITPPGSNVRTRVHEYGGGAYIVVDGVVYFSHDADQRLYRQTPGNDPQPLTPTGKWRYADAVMDAQRDRLICVREDHTVAGAEPTNTLVAITLQAETSGMVLVSGHDFYSSPRLSPDGTQLAWLSWDHPQMPWDGTELWVAEVCADGSLGDRRCVAGCSTKSVVQPEWSPDGVLYFVSDRTGWWNLYRWRDGAIEPLCPKAAEFGLPHWVFGMTTYGFASVDTLVCTYHEAGQDHLAQIHLPTLELTEMTTSFTGYDGIRVSGHVAAFIGSHPTQPSAIARLDLHRHDVQILQRSSTLEVDPGYISIPQAIEFPTEHGLTAHGFYYPPFNRDFEAPDGEHPPLLVKIHGGPTAATSASFSLRIQYWTSRGIAVLDVNYGGSTGYGRDYRNRLQGNWGIVDVDDCVNGAKYLVAQGLADRDRLMIDGGSAGGYTTLAALTFRDTFKAGASLYGVSDAEILATDTHKFESRYLDSLIGPYPERQDLYRQRSPIHFVDQLSCPVIFFQGDEDKVVPPNQAERMVTALNAKGIPVAYVLFAGEQHGFRKAENIKRAIEGELYFYARIFGFELGEVIEPVAIANLPDP